MATASSQRIAEPEFSEASLADRFMRPAKLPQPISYEFTKDIGLLYQYRQLREDMFFSVWGMERGEGQQDVFDETGYTLVAKLGNLCVAGVRLTVVPAGQMQRLPMEKGSLVLQDIFSNLRREPCAYGEISQLAVLPDFRNDAMIGEMIRQLVKKAVSLGVQYLYSATPMPMARDYRRAVELFGLKCEMRKDIVVPDRDESDGAQLVLSVMDLTPFALKKAATKTGKPQKAHAE